MNLSEKNANALLLDINQNIEEYAEATVENIISRKRFNSLVYPPNNRFTDSEKAELNKLDNNEHLKNALRKILADNSAVVVFEMFNLIDGTTSPKQNEDEWTGVKLIDEEESDNPNVFSDMLHDSFFEHYWEWKKIRGEKDWRLDNE